MRASISHTTPPITFSGLWLPLITPFRDDAVDHVALTGLVKHYAKLGVSGFVVCGSTGEAAALDDAEQLAVLQTVHDHAGDVPVVMGVSGYNLPKMLAWVKLLSAYPIAGVLVPAPHYIRPSQAGLEAWFTTIADAAKAPLIIYDIPYRTGVVIELATLMRLAAHPNIKAIKDCGGDPAKTRALIADSRLAVLAGEDMQLFTTIAQGGAGSITASAHVHTADFVEVIRHLRNGDLTQARRAWEPLPRVIEAMFAEPNPACIKAALAAQGLIQNELRLPMMAARAV
jgi:4-hydroxy-tetrahydrodipicolinate synthase